MGDYKQMSLIRRKTSGRNKYKRILFAVLFLFFILGAAILYCKKITLHLSVYFNGQEVSLKNLDAACIYEEDKACEVISDNGVYKTNGGAYGRYAFEVVIPGERLTGYDKDIILHLNYINTNWRYISKSDCIVDITSKNEDRVLVNYKISWRYFGDRNLLQDEDETELDKDTIDIQWGV